MGTKLDADGNESVEYRSIDSIANEKWILRFDVGDIAAVDSYNINHETVAATDNDAYYNDHDNDIWLGWWWR